MTTEEAVQTQIGEDTMPEFSMYDVEVSRIAEEDLLGPEPSADFIASIKDTNGPLVPIITREAGEFRHRVIEGRRRVRACLALGITRIPARVVADNGWGNDAVLSFIANEQRSENVVVSLQKLEELVSKGWDREKIAAVVRCKPRAVDRYLSLARLMPTLRLAFTQGALGVGLAYRCSKLDHDQQRHLIEIYNANGRLTGKDITDVAAAAKVQPNGLFDQDEALAEAAQCLERAVELFPNLSQFIEPTLVLVRAKDEVVTRPIALPEDGVQKVTGEIPMGTTTMEGIAEDTPADVLEVMHAPAGAVQVGPSDEDEPASQRVPMAAGDVEVIRVLDDENAPL